MSEHPHKFRYLLPPGNNFHFVRKFRYWLIASIVLMIASVAVLFINKSVRGEYMNWTIDFKGGTDIIFAFKDKSTGDFTKVDPGKVREALQKAGDHGVELSDITYTEDTPKGEQEVHGLIVHTPRFSALQPEQKTAATTDFLEKFKDHNVGKATWSGDRLFVRTSKPITHEEATA